MEPLECSTCKFWQGTRDPYGTYARCKAADETGSSAVPQADSEVEVWLETAPWFFCSMHMPKEDTA